jgi:hypothetical protein
MAASSLESCSSHLDHVLVRAAVQRTFQRADGRGDRRIDVRQRGRRHARGESGSVELVVGVQGQGHVEGVLHHVVGPLAGQRVKKVFSEAHGRVAADHMQTFAQRSNVVTMVEVCAIRRSALRVLASGVMSGVSGS